ncbi:DUF7455 domain-containing protein [Actinocrinis sp.]|uniref:DUF7455 domain-containing protein n=1 Tax=Actinocrinis sp. TaxID=1920516 RepID=UPI002D4D5080|nr:hypothetical protein [Actinocrinis sp.]HZP51343.1 hypothetical protein [Actinocrinis sp.]
MDGKPGTETLERVADGAIAAAAAAAIGQGDVWRVFEPLPTSNPACCCCAQPVVRVVMPVTDSEREPTDLLLCGHHFRVSRAALAAAGAVVFDAGDVLVRLPA